MNDKPISNSKRQKYLRQRRKEKGLVRLEVWTYPWLKEKIKEMVRVLNGKEDKV